MPIRLSLRGPASAALLTVASLGAGLLAGCVRQPAPATSGAPAPAPAGPERRWHFAYAPGSYTYLVESSAVIDLTGDTTSARDSVRTSAVFQYRLTSAPGGLAVAGTVDSFQVTAGRTGVVQRPLTAPVPFEALVDTTARALVLRGAMAGALTTPDCASPGRGLVVAARELLVVPPTALEQGQTWRDTVTTVTCRGDIPITNPIEQRYEVEGRDSYAGVAAVRLRRRGHTTLAGSASPRGQAVTLSGDGTTDARLWVDAAAGRLLGGSGEATTKITLSAAGQSRSFTQRALQRITLRGLAP